MKSWEVEGDFKEMGTEWWRVGKKRYNETEMIR